MSTTKEDDELESNEKSKCPVWTREVQEPLFVNDTEIMRRLGISEDTWRRIRLYFEGEGLPKKDPIVNKRYWPAVKQ